MKRLLVSLAAVGLLVGLAAVPVAAAPGGVARNPDQVTTTVYYLTIGAGHTFTIVFNGCDGSLVATGGQTGGPTETITATLSNDGMYINISSVYNGGWGGSPYSWTGGFPVAGGTGTATVVGTTTTYTFPVTILSTSTTTTTYANHGAYVSASGGGADAAHSCIGMPIVAQP